MASLRLCSHIKTNGVKCGSPALRHHTLCYFHYQWQKRDQRRIRLGGPIGMNKNSGIELPLLDGPEAIMVSIMEIQRAIVDQRIPVKTATALLYSLQLALQARIPYSGLCGREPVRECPELDNELELERAKSLRPTKEKCSACPKQETCTSPRNCRKLPKLPAGYRREADHLIRTAESPSLVQATDPSVCHAEERSDEASLSTARPSTPDLPITLRFPRPSVLRLPSRTHVAPHRRTPQKPVLTLTRTVFWDLTPTPSQFFRENFRNSLNPHERKTRGWVNRKPGLERPGWKHSRLRRWRIDGSVGA